MVQTVSGREVHVVETAVLSRTDRLTLVSWRRERAEHLFASRLCIHQLAVNLLLLLGPSGGICRSLAAPPKQPSETSTLLWLALVIVLQSRIPQFWFLRTWLEHCLTSLRLGGCWQSNCRFKHEQTQLPKIQHAKSKLTFHMKWQEW